MAQIPEKVAGKMGSDKPPVGWPWRLFLFSSLVLLAMVILYFGLEFGYKTYLNAQINAKDEKINELARAVSPEENQRFTDFYSQMANLRVLLDEHTFASRLLPLLENNTSKSVYYDSLSFSMKDRRLVLSGIATDYKTLSQQLEAFERNNDIEKVLINESKREGTRVRFRVSLFLNPGLFVSYSKL